MQRVWVQFLVEKLRPHMPQGQKNHTKLETEAINPKGYQSWIFIERTDAEAKTPILWSPDVKSQLIGKDSDAMKDWVQEEKR